MLSPAYLGKSQLETCKSLGDRLMYFRIVWQVKVLQHVPTETDISPDTLQLGR